MLNRQQIGERASQEIKIVVTICSRQRPEMLTRALKSLTQLRHPPDCQVQFAVVENDSKPRYASIVSDFSSKISICHVVEPTPGLCHARNRALDVAIELEADWLGFVDDDQIIDSVWLAAMVQAVRSYPDTDMFVGKWRRIEPPNTPSWYPRSVDAADRTTGTKITAAAGGNTLFSARVFSPSGMGLRFNQQFTSIPGEDTEFGVQYLKKGGIIRHVQEAVTTEEVHAERHSIQDRIIRNMWSRYSLAMIRHIHDHPIVAWLWDVQVMYRASVLGVANILLGAAIWPFRKNLGKNRIAHGRIFFAHVQGTWRYHFGKAGGLYLTKTGR